MKDWLIKLSMVKFVWLVAVLVFAIRVLDVFLNGGSAHPGGEFLIAILVTLKVGWDKKRAEGEPASPAGE
jgi:hypothetical protein